MNSEKQIEELRKLFPVTEHWTYLYNGSIHPCAVPVKEAMQNYLEKWQNGGEAAFFKAYDDFTQLKEEFAELIDAKTDNIVITESTTAAINLAGHLIKPTAQQNVVVTDLAFMSNTYPWLAGQLANAEVRFVKSRDGKIHLDDLVDMVDDNTAVVHICAVTVGSGYRFDLAQIYDITSKFNVSLMIDGAQALGVVDINIKEIPMDFLATTASKWLMGPAGVGFLYMDDRYLKATPPSVGWLSAKNVSDWNVRNCILHDDAMRFQGGIPNLIGVTGALAGLKLLKQIGREFIESRINELTTYVIEKLSRLNVDIVTPSNQNERAGIIFFRTPDYLELHARLKAENIYCGCFQEGIRVDPGFYNTYEELDKFLSVVKDYMTH
ncbi:MAG: aminotransferase class V-fold PLP-dependent enzyme [Spirochaetales bacterium]|nr:aminotransferase class V-fold PLP-dependent enzyme [Spirochaetales bacterium]